MLLPVQQFNHTHFSLFNLDSSWGKKIKNKTELERKEVKVIIHLSEKCGKHYYLLILLKKKKLISQKKLISIEIKQKRHCIKRKKYIISINL